MFKKRNVKKKEVVVEEIKEEVTEEVAVAPKQPDINNPAHGNLTYEEIQKL